jgi:hypothetical protein
MGILYGKESNLPNATTHRMDMRKGTEADRKAILKEFRDYFDEKEEVLQRLVPPGIRTIKQVELYLKWRKHVPDEHKSPLYDNPGEDVLKSVKDDRRSKKEYIAARRQLEHEAESSGKKASRKTSAVVKAAASRQKDTKSDSDETETQPRKITKRTTTAKGRKTTRKRKT